MKSDVWRKPAQSRSQRTHDAILDAAELLLEKKSLDEITTIEIATKAGVTTGAIYGRFKSKSDLLPHLYERYLDWIDQSVPKWFERIDWQRKNAAQASQKAAELIIRLHKTKPWLLRAMVLYVRAAPRRETALINGHSQLVQVILDSLSQSRSQKASSERALVFTIHTALTVAREVIVFGDTPMARAVSHDNRSLKFRLSKVIENGLTAGQ